MGIIDKFGHIVENTCCSDPARAGRLLKLGWQAQNFKFRHFPDKRLSRSGAYLSVLLMDAMLAPLRDPGNTAIVSVFTPCELLHTYGIKPFNAEGFSCYIAASHAENSFLKAAEEHGLPETFCSYHKVFLGAAYKKLLPSPKCIISTNLACDANQITFRELADHYKIPHFYIDVPVNISDASVSYVASQLKELDTALSKLTGKAMDTAALKNVLQRSKNTVKNYKSYMAARADKCLLQDLVTPLYEFVTMNILLGTVPALKYTSMALNDALGAPKAEGVRLFWIHTVPYLQNELKNILNFSKKAQIVGIDMASSALADIDPDKPYEAMARRMVYNSFNGTASHRIDAALSQAKSVNADGAIWFCHCGCKNTLGASSLAKETFEKNGMPLLIMNGDGCDRSSGNEGQNTTRIEAFIEMLEQAKDNRP